MLYFAATTNVTGNELWRLPLPNRSTHLLLNTAGQVEFRDLNGQDGQYQISSPHPMIRLLIMQRIYSKTISMITWQISWGKAFRKCIEKTSVAPYGVLPVNASSRNFLKST
jgi:hypothetical protein